MTRPSAVTREIRQAHSRPSARVDAAVLVILLALIPLRAMMNETHTLEIAAVSRALDAPPSPMTGTTLVLSAMIFLCAVLIGCTRLWNGGPRFQWTGGEAGAVLVLIAGCMSAYLAGQKRIAINGVADFVALLVYFVTLRQVLTRPVHLRLLLAVVLATGVLVAGKCLMQVWYEYPETLKFYQEQSAQNAEADVFQGDAGKRYDFEQRLKSQAATAFFAHSNVAGTYLATIAVIALTLVGVRWRTERAGDGPIPPFHRLAPCLVPVLVAALAAAVLPLTQSNGALLALAAGVGLWLLWRLLGDWAARHRRRALAAFWGLAFAAVMLTAAYGIVTGGLPGRSMLFRWFYWRGAAAMIQSQGVWGVGPENFGRLFTRYKPLECPEDVNDPHSWLVRAAVEWGWMGLVGLPVLWIGISIRLARGNETSAPPRGRPATSEAAESGDTETGAVSMFRWLAGVLGVALGAYLVIHMDALRNPNHAIFLFTGMVEICVVWAAAFALLCVERRDVAFVLNAPLPGLIPGLAIAAIVFLLHSSIDLALFWPGPATLLFAVLAAALAAQVPCPSAAPVARPALPVEPFRAPGRGLAVGYGTVGTAIVAVFVVQCVRPQLRAGRAIDEARRISSGSSWSDFEAGGKLSAYGRARDADPLDSAAVLELLDETTGDGSRLLNSASICDQALGWVEQVRQRDPFNAAAHGHAARIYLARFGITRNADDLTAAAAEMNQAVEAYPTSPQRRLAYAQVLAELAREKGDPLAAQRAANELWRALWLDESRIYVSPPHHFTEEQRAHIRAEMERLERTSERQEPVPTGKVPP